MIPKKLLRSSILAFGIIFISANAFSAQPIREMRVGIAVTPTVLREPGWEEKFKKQLAYVSKIFETEFRIRFRPVGFWDWPVADEKAGMTYLFGDLKSKFPLKEADFVIGVCALGEDAAIAGAKDPHVIGRTGIFSGYVLLRHPSRPLLYIQEETVLAHEIGHLFGAAHSTDKTSMMSAVVERQIPSRFDTANREIIQRTRDIDFKRGLESMDAAMTRQLLGTYVAMTKGQQSSEFYYSLGRFYLKLGQTEEARKAWEVAIQFKDDNPHVHYDLGMLYSKMGKKAEAVRELSLAVNQLDHPSENKRKATALNVLGSAWLTQGDLDAAYRSFSQALVLVPTHTDAKINLGVVQLKRGQYQLAVDAFLAVLKKEPKHPKLLFHLGTAYYRLGHMRQAIDFLNQAKTINPKSAGEVNEYLGYAHLKMSGPEEAVGYFEASCQARPSAACYKRLAQVYQKLNRWDDVLRASAAVMKKVNNDPEIYSMISSAFIQKKDYEKAAGALKEALRYTKDKKKNAVYHARLGNVYRIRKAIDLAKQEFQMAVANDWHNLDGHLGLAQIYLTKNDPAQAILSLNRVLQINPKHASARAALMKLEGRAR